MKHIRTTIAELMRQARLHLYPHEKMQTPKRQTRYTYVDGPMTFLAQQVVKLMEDSGYPAKILYVYRSPKKQAELYQRTPPVTKAPPFESAHQYYEASDIIHPRLGWDVSEHYWETLANCWAIVADKYDVDISHGHYWNFRDSAHCQLRDWRTFKDLVGEERPTEEQLDKRFYQVLPKVWREKFRVNEELFQKNLNDGMTWMMAKEFAIIIS